MNAPIDWLFGIASRGTAGLLVWSWQALVLVICAWSILKICRVKSPTVRHQVWLFSLIALALLPAATAVAGKFPEVRPASPTLSYMLEVPRMVIAFSPGPAARNQQIEAPPKNPARTFSQPKPWLFLARPLLFVMWLIGSLIVLARLVKNQLGLRRTRKRARSIRPVDLGIPTCEALIRGKVSLLLSNETDSPLLSGAFHPTVLLPADIAEWTSPRERSAMIQHEIAHVERLDPLVNFFQTVLSVIFFFHPSVRYACRQLSLERELACDDRVVALGTCAETYVEGLLKVAERSVMPGAGYQLAFFTTKQILERRIEMILNSERGRTGARPWKFMVLAAGLIAIIAWVLIMGSLKPGNAQLSDKPAPKVQLVKALGDKKDFDDLIEMALRNPDALLRRLAMVRLTELEGDGSTQAMVALYNQTDEPEVKNIMIDTLARISEIEPLTKIALSDPNPEYRLKALRRVKWLKANSDSGDVKAWDVSMLTDQLNQVSAQPPPPPPPPSPVDMTVEDKTLSPLRGHKSGESVFTLLRELAYAAMRHDSAFFDRVLDENYIGTMVDGETRTKVEEIAQIMDRDRQITKVEFDELRVSNDDGEAVATVVGKVYHLVGGQTSVTPQRYTVHLTTSNGQMKITAIDRR
jgi:beta-lactamase regulating signal transducer with metallopeptidase domain